jgi:chromosome segregation ATPase
MSSVALPVSTRRNRLLGTPADSLTLRVLNKEHHGRELSLRGAKCSVGSAPGCTLRLRGAGVSPLHCLILRGPGGTIVRCRSSRTLLNGAPFDDAPLRPGDRLQIGPVELEVVACTELDESWQAGAAELPPLVALSRERDQFESAAVAAEREAANLRTRVVAVESQSAGRVAELTAQVAELAAERDALSSRLESAELLAAERAALLAEQATVVEALTTGQAELAAMKSHLAARENEIEGMLQEETRRVTEIQDRLEDALRERQTLESRLREQADALREEAASRELERERLIGECERLDEELNKLRELVGYTAAERDQLTLQMGQEQERVAGELRSLREQQGEMAQVHRERAQLQERLDLVQAQLAAAQQQIAVLQVEGDHHLHSEMEQTTELRRQLEQAEFAKAELAERLERQARDWQLERECLREQADRVSGQCGQLEQQLMHIRTVFDSLAAERDRLAGELAEASERGMQDVRALAGDRDALAQQLAALEGERQRLETQWAEQSEQAKAAEARLAEIERRADLADEWQLQATEANDRVVFLQEQLADVELRLETATTEFQTELAAARQAAADWECKTGELQIQLTSVQLELRAAENLVEGKQSAWQAELAAAEARRAEFEQAAIQSREELSAALAQLASLEAREAERLAGPAAGQTDPSDEVAAWQGRAEAAESERQQLEAQLDDLSEKVRFERETWHTDRERLHQECRMLGQRLIQQQRELDTAHADLKELRQSTAANLPGQTLTMDQLGQLAGGGDELVNEQETLAREQLTQERAAWEAERQELTTELQQLRQELEAIAAAAHPAANEAKLCAEAAAAREPSALSVELGEQLARLQTEQAEETARRKEAEAAAAEAAAAREQAEASLADVRTQLAGAEGLRQQVANLEGQLATDRCAAASAQERLAALEAELAERQTALAELQERLAAAASESQEDVQSERNAERARLEQELIEREQSIERQAAELSHRLALADERLAEAEALRAELERERELLAQMQDQLVRESASQVDSNSPTSAPQAADSAGTSSLTSLFANRTEEHEVPAPRDSVPLGNLSEQKPVWMQAQSPAPPADDDSIEDYMSRLLRRVRGEGPPPAVPYQFPAQSSAPAPSEPPATSAPPASVVAASQEASAVTPYRPRATAPELSTDLKAMRELANSACRTAIVKHQKHRGGREVLSQLVGIVLALVVSGVVAGVAIALKSWLAGFAALAGFVAVAYWSLRAMVRALQIIRLSSPAVRNSDVDDAAPQIAAGEPEPPAEIGALDPRADARLEATEMGSIDSPASADKPVDAEAELTATPPASASESAGDRS